MSVGIKTNSHLVKVETKAKILLMFTLLLGSFLLLHLLLLSVKDDFFRGYRLHWSSSFLLAKLKKLTILAFLYCGEFVITVSHHTKHKVVCAR